MFNIFGLKNNPFVPFYPSEYFKELFDASAEKDIRKKEEEIQKYRDTKAINELYNIYKENLNRDINIKSTLTKTNTALNILSDLSKEIDFYIGKVNTVYTNIMTSLSIILSALVFGLGNGILKSGENKTLLTCCFVLMVASVFMLLILNLLLILIEHMLIRWNLMGILVMSVL